MLVPDGKTVFLGGLIKHSVSDTREGVPGLGDVPVIGGLFSNNATSLTSTEIVILITPRIVNNSLDEPVENDNIDRVQVINEILDGQIEESAEEMKVKFKDDDQDSVEPDSRQAPDLQRATISRFLLTQE